VYPWTGAQAVKLCTVLFMMISQLCPLTVLSDLQTGTCPGWMVPTPDKHQVQKVPDIIAVVLQVPHRRQLDDALFHLQVRITCRKYQFLVGEG
jgi:hypothetical protein